ncbi:MAG: cytidylate kinase [Candidatus Edwardsbacteria bacterium RIFOXYD12_FULL_50_11]|uniref:Cytidylate kinase n=1 Tax=Candidatus Edwardsbacteria bacterium GWF2_54_11 TaxID=1817851 RepID=A0A1F5RJF2_9BACT|nr:MAG: cytidylate kinase [Candidatus Edwardsbacteria bacterium RifOxyC12_full_54_24]OGF08739.1 MAG: cytidylate kinase [Candidatus Edwardsbacteria bacterium RifOxyA12_full_54_48]OGF12332.1 MAG: cytidylate kinase [Candidatus Edwardsbacteria bacterium GWE2_54_12]OGF14323.1 MAG: cytidylate kinase [Candidatus Edwardsbacteria bacterium GWF2_54_11]OGF17773.1 MAG: cytidylate kinase [Candidatus Edwardsbacteria bacterium RIFOXYD12_FULL_50_11]OGJ18196.1 MAG: cytidylate kinase [Candidatus Edwardsbacteria
MVIAIDGPAASGKSTTAKLVARELGYLYIDTGAMYRAMALKAFRENVSLNDRASVAKIVESTTIEQKPGPDGIQTILDGRDVSQDIRTPEISLAASDISAISMVRQRLVKLQQEMGRQGGVVMEGRDITTVVFPDADVKVFMKAGISQRARRRMEELTARGAHCRLEDIERQIAERDAQDSQRADSPLLCTPDSLVIDTSALSIGQQVEQVLAAVRQKAGTA